MIMSSVIDTLEQRVADAADLIASLRETVSRLAQELENDRTGIRADPAAPASPPIDPALAGELERLRAERAAIRDRIRGLLREIDRVSW
jgi:FtsZ-binding cell division protein ZapB